MPAEPSLHTSSRGSPPNALVAWDIPGLCHGFLGRSGGVSSGPYASFNLAGSVGDDPSAVAENWHRWNAMYPAMRVARVAQVHANTVHAVSDSYSDRRGDGMVSDRPGVALGIFTADCVPILAVDVERGVVGAFHAGWRGTLADIAAAGLSAMARLGARPHELRVALGPSIGPCCFEVDAELADQFARQIPGAPVHTQKHRQGKALLNLRGIIRDQLARLGTDPVRIADIGPCTRCSNERYFSRRAAGGTVTGLQMSFIGFAP